jgi:hypothetical protein
MKRAVLACLATLLVAAPAFGADTSLEKARLLYTNKLYDEAKRELVAVVVSEAPVEEKAQALNMLGDICDRTGQLPGSHRQLDAAHEHLPNVYRCRRSQGQTAARSQAGRLATSSLNFLSSYRANRSGCGEAS